jgi:tight adherence protein C
MPVLAGALAAAAVVSAFGAFRPRHMPIALSPADQDRRPSAPGRRASRRRARQVEGEVPQLLDLLAAGSTAGLSAELSLRRAAEALRGPLGEDLRGVAHLADLGARWRDELDAYATATGSVDLKRTMAVIRRTESLGASLADATRELAATVRQTRRAATLERARTAPVKMLFPLVFLILPAFLLLTVVPVLLTTVRSIH